jgi:hypothetical protein
MSDDLCARLCAGSTASDSPEDRINQHDNQCEETPVIYLGEQNSGVVTPSTMSLPGTPTTEECGDEWRNREQIHQVEDVSMKSDQNGSKKKLAAVLHLEQQSPTQTQAKEKGNLGNLLRIQ